jgi:hypothetical protein
VSRFWTVLDSLGIHNRVPNRFQSWTGLMESKTEPGPRLAGQSGTGAEAPSTPLPEVDGLEAWRERLANTCPGCGLKKLNSDGRCTVCGSRKNRPSPDCRSAAESLSRRTTSPETPRIPQESPRKRWPRRFMVPASRAREQRPASPPVVGRCGRQPQARAELRPRPFLFLHPLAAPLRGSEFQNDV